MNGLGISSTAGSAPTAMYRPNFSQAFQRAGPYPLFPGGTPFTAGSGLLTNGALRFVRNVKESMLIGFVLQGRQI